MHHCHCSYDSYDSDKSLRESCLLCNWEVQLHFQNCHNCSGHWCECWLRGGQAFKHVWNSNETRDEFCSKFHLSCRYLARHKYLVVFSLMMLFNSMNFMNVIWDYIRRCSSMTLNTQRRKKITFFLALSATEMRPM